MPGHRGASWLTPPLHLPASPVSMDGGPRGGLCLQQPQAEQLPRPRATHRHPGEQREALAGLRAPKLGSRRLPPPVSGLQQQTDSCPAREGFAVSRQTCCRLAEHRTLGGKTDVRSTRWALRVTSPVLRKTEGT